jgi:carbon monoxide dehydrogenase subunit G
MTTISAESSAIIHRPIQEVWDFVADPRNEPKWHTDILDIRSAADPASGPGHNWVVGKTLLVTVQFMGRRDYEVEVTKKQDGRLLEITTVTGPMKPVATYLFERSNGGTRFTRHVDIPVEGAMRLLRPLMRRNAKRRNAQFVQNLKSLLEAKAA